MKTMLRILVCLLLSGICVSCTNSPDNAEDISRALQMLVYRYDRDTGTFTQTALEPQTPVIVCDSTPETNNINIQFLFEGGTCEVTAEDRDIQLSVGQTGGVWPSSDLGHSRAYGYSFEIGHEGYVAAIPLGSSGGHFNMEKQPDIDVMVEELRGTRCIGREYILTVEAKDMDTTLITAKLRFTQLRDRFDLEGVDNINDYLADYIGDFEVELISYEYSYVYEMMQ